MKHSGSESPPGTQVIGTKELEHRIDGRCLISFKKVKFQTFMSSGSDWMSILQSYFPRSFYLENKHSGDMTGMLCFPAVIKHCVFPLES